MFLGARDPPAARDLFRMVGVVTQLGHGDATELA
jgi:hypothetical protein